MNRVAVILPVYINDRVEFLQQAVESIILQTYKAYHLCIGVDGPVNDDLGEYLRSIETQPKVTVVRYKENRGLARVLNDLLELCLKNDYEYIARMDADDISLPDRFEKQLRYLQEHEEIDVVGGAIDEIDEKGMRRDKVIAYPQTPEECRRFFAYRNPHAHPAVMFRRSFFERTGIRYRPEYRQNQDTMLWYDGMMAGTKHANIPDVVLQFRMTDALFKKRRNGWAFAKKQLQDRLMINRSLGYGIKADLFGYAMFLLLISPAWLKKIAYRCLR